MNWRRTNMGYGRNISVLNDRETRDNGLLRIPASNFFWLGSDSDSRKNISGGLDINVGDDWDGYYRGIRFSTRI